MVLHWFLFPVKNNCFWYRVLNLLLYKMCWIHYEDELCCELIAVLIKHMHAGCGLKTIPAGKITVFCFLPGTWLASISAKSLIRIFRSQSDLSAWSGSFILGALFAQISGWWFLTHWFFCAGFYCINVNNFTVVTRDSIMDTDKPVALGLSYMRWF